MQHIHLLLWNWLFLGILANVEKTIFIAPPATSVPQDASIDNLLLLPFNPQNLNARTYLNASFPSDQNPKGIETWALLEGLTPGQRYELRICWLATQPTNFWIYTHTLDETFNEPLLITSLSSYAHARHGIIVSDDLAMLESRREVKNSQSNDASMLFLHIFAAADYFTLNRTLMDNVPPVFVDIILDPFLMNVFPQSLVSTAGYIAIVAIIAWFLSGWIYSRLSELSKAGTKQTSDTKKVR